MIDDRELISGFNSAIDRLLSGEPPVAVEEDVDIEIRPYVEIFALLLETAHDPARPEFRATLRARFVGSADAPARHGSALGRVAAFVAGTFLVGSAVNPVLAQNLVTSISETMGHEVAEAVERLLDASPLQTGNAAAGHAPASTPQRDLGESPLGGASLLDPAVEEPQGDLAVGDPAAVPPAPAIVGDPAAPAAPTAPPVTAEPAPPAAEVSGPANPAPPPVPAAPPASEHVPPVDPATTPPHGSPATDDTTDSVEPDPSPANPPAATGDDPAPAQPGKGNGNPPGLGRGNDHGRPPEEAGNSADPPSSPGKGHAAAQVEAAQAHRDSTPADATPRSSDPSQPAPEHPRDKDSKPRQPGV